MRNEAIDTPICYFYKNNIEEPLVSALSQSTTSNSVHNVKRTIFGSLTSSIKYSGSPSGGSLVMLYSGIVNLGVFTDVFVETSLIISVFF